MKLKTEPGPGQYKLMAINLEGKYASSKVPNVRNCCFCNSKSRRFIYKTSDTPAPNAYFPNEKLSLINGTGFNFSSKYRSTVALTFGGHAGHPGTTKDLKGVPGPGTYNYFSDFNGYANSKSLKEQEEAMKKIKEEEKNADNQKKKNNQQKKNEKKNEEKNQDENKNENQNNENNKAENENKAEEKVENKQQNEEQNNQKKDAAKENENVPSSPADNMETTKANENKTEERKERDDEEL